jgi:hypothetical protein
MATEHDSDEHVIINVDDAWYKVPLAQMEGYRVDPDELGVELDADGEVEGFGFEPPVSPNIAGFPGDGVTGLRGPPTAFNPARALVGDQPSPMPTFRRGTAFFPGGR